MMLVWGRGAPADVNSRPFTWWQMKLSITTKAHRHESAKYSMTGTSYCKWVPGASSSWEIQSAYGILLCLPNQRRDISRTFIRMLWRGIEYDCPNPLPYKTERKIYKWRFGLKCSSSEKLTDGKSLSFDSLKQCRVNAYKRMKQVGQLPLKTGLPRPGLQISCPIQTDSYP